MNAHLVPIGLSLLRLSSHSLLTRFHRLGGCGLSELTLSDPCQHCEALVSDFEDCTKIMAGTQAVLPLLFWWYCANLAVQALLVSMGKASVEAAATRSTLGVVECAAAEDLLSLAHREQFSRHVVVIGTVEESRS